MSGVVNFKIDDKDCIAQADDYLVKAAERNGIFIPTLCNYKGIKPKGSCRMCTVRINNRLMTACTTKVSEGMIVESKTEELETMRKSIIELLFAEGNHFCPSCEKSGFCELQALAYRYRVTVPSFPYLFPVRPVEAKHKKLMKDQNRCILCKRCIRALKDADGKSLFAFDNRGHKVAITIDTELAADMSDELAEQAMNICPVGAIIKKRIGFKVPIGERLYDKQEIGNDIEAKA
jgi:[NiFe] hydrogenase diaphorase moiety small subunit